MMKLPVWGGFVMTTEATKIR